MSRLISIFWQISYQTDRQTENSGRLTNMQANKQTDIQDRASGRSREKKSNFAGFSGTNSWKKRGNFRGQFRWKTIGKERRISCKFRFPSKFRWKAIGFALIWGKFSMKLDALIAFSQASYCNMKSYLTTKLIEHKNKY